LFVPLFLFICVFFSSLTILDWKFWIYNLIPSMYALIFLNFSSFLIRIIFPIRNFKLEVFFIWFSFSVSFRLNVRDSTLS
jgi:hypothetical protein